MALENEKKDYGQVHFAWKFSEFPQYERGKNWYVLGGVVAFGLLIFSLITKDFLFGLIVVMVVLIFLLFQRTTKEVEFKIFEDGITVNDSFFDYKMIKNFFIIYNPPEVKTLYFEPKNILSPRIPISLENQNPVEVRHLLKQYLDEDLTREHEPLSDQIARMFKF
ncbi:MAG: hypothetical protein WCX71_03470 [Candidatus Buchananbacteria bacterium]